MKKFSMALMLTGLLVMQVGCGEEAAPVNTPAPDPGAMTHSATGAAHDGADAAKDGADAAKDGADAAKEGADAAKDGADAAKEVTP